MVSLFLRTPLGESIQQVFYLLPLNEKSQYSPQVRTTLWHSVV
ncbi:MAG: hypothetical protein ACKO37_09100 [Vampirovibrionales bacterium]